MKHKIGSQVLVKINPTKIMLGKIIGYDGYVFGEDAANQRMYYIVMIEGDPRNPQQVSDEQLIRDSAEADQSIRENLK